MKAFYPSCNYAIASRENAKKLRAIMKEKMDVAGCCLYDKRDPKDVVGVYMCQHCRETIETKMPTLSLWEYLLEIEYPFPQYNHTKMVLQDCWRDRNHPEIHDAVREILHRMQIDVVEMKYNRQNARFCGTLHYETDNAELHQRISQYPNTKISDLPEELQCALMQDNFRDVDPDLTIIVDCNRCKKGVELAGRKAEHLMDLILTNNAQED